LWQARETQAIASIRKLKSLARETGAALWPNHDLAFWRTLPACVGTPR
jgi:N-acyl homoserine lactone hydrolase